MTQRTVGKAALFPLQPNRCTQSENEEGNGRRNLFFPLAIGPPSPDFNVVRRTMFKNYPAISGVAFNIEIGGRGVMGEWEEESPPTVPLLPLRVSGKDWGNNPSLRWSCYACSTTLLMLANAFFPTARCKYNTWHRANLVHSR